MFYHAKGKSIPIGNTHMDYVVFGKGNQSLVLIPGLGDGLKTVKGQALFLARYYKLFARDFKVYIFSRKNEMPTDYTTRDMAQDQQTALTELGIENAHVIGISQGGMIAQHLAIDYPESIQKLVIAVSVSKQNPTLQDVVRRWIKMAQLKDYKTLIVDTIEKTFTDKKIKFYRPFYPIISRIGTPKSFDRFLIQAEACIHHNAYDLLNTINCPTLVIGGDSDHVVGKHSSEDIAEQVKESKLVLYEGLGHGAYEETKDFNQQIKNFLLA